MGILFKHQEELEQAAKPNKATKQAKPPPLPVELSPEPVKKEAVRPDPPPPPRAEPLTVKPEPVTAVRPVEIRKEALPPAPPALPSRGDPRFSVEEFLKLTRSLPVNENAGLVLKVVEAALASVDVKMSEIQPEIGRRESVLRDRIEAIQKRIEDLSMELLDQRAELTKLEGELAETAHLRNLLNPAKANELKANGFHRDTSVEETVVLSSSKAMPTA